MGLSRVRTGGVVIHETLRTKLAYKTEISAFHSKFGTMGLKTLYLREDIVVTTFYALIKVSAINSGKHDFPDGVYSEPSAFCHLV